nr:phosphocholine cytidylyltransferase family protein [Lachnospiraceae bacterium]
RNHYAKHNSGWFQTFVMRGTTQWWSPYDIDWPPTLVMRGTTKWCSPYDREKEGALHYAGGLSMTAKAVILVAGMGTRLQPRTLTTHKCLTRVNGTPILFNALDNLKDIGVEETVLVIGYLGDEIKKEIGSDHKGMKITYAVNDIYAQTNTSFSLKEGLSAVGDFDVLYLLEGDVFFDNVLLRRLVDDTHENTTMVEPYEPRLDGTFVELADDGFVADWTHKSMREENYVVEDKYKTINIHKFSAGFTKDVLTPCLNDICEETNGKSPLENIMRRIVRNDSHAVYGLTSGDGLWFEIDDENDLKIAEEIFK